MLALSLWACQHANVDAASMAADSLKSLWNSVSCSANFYKTPNEKIKTKLHSVHWGFNVLTKHSGPAG